MARTSRRIRRSSHASTLSCAPMRVSSALIASPSRTTTRSAPRTSRHFAVTPSRRAAPTSAIAASGPGQVTSSAELRPGSVSEPWARNAPAPGRLRVAHPAGHDGRRQAAHRAAAGVEQAGLAGQALAVAHHPQHVPGAAAQPARA